MCSKTELLNINTKNTNGKMNYMTYSYVNTM